MSDWKTIWDRALLGQVETDSTSAELSKVRSLLIQVEHEGGYGTPDGLYDRTLLNQIEYKTGNTQSQLRSLVIQVECEIGYPTIPLLSYAPRMLVDMFLDSGSVHYSTEEVYLEEL